MNRTDHKRVWGKARKKKQQHIRALSIKQKEELIAHELHSSKSKTSK